MCSPHARLIADQNGRAVRMLGVSLNVTREVESELLRERFERAIQGTQDGLWELEANGASWSSPGLDQPRLKELIGQLAAEFVRAADFLKLQVQLPV